MGTPGEWAGRPYAQPLAAYGWPTITPLKSGVKDVFKVKDWMTQKALGKFAPMIQTALRDLSDDEWEDALCAFDSLQELVDAEIDRRVDGT